ncbi:caspase family protein [Bradyrhizobium sp. HKCCYLS1011]|uniref:caspase family protein n=1 Tax=Bradyrhizobium sp. HKCCYLS1011 TaxID=3420733 RepID=UPI003EC14F62
MNIRDAVTMHIPAGPFQFDPQHLARRQLAVLNYANTLTNFQQKVAGTPGPQYTLSCSFMTGNDLAEAGAVKIIRFVGLLIFLLAAAFGISTEVRAEGRVALVIGNATYLNAPPLRNSKNDADDISQQLRRLDFDVVDGRDLDGRGMRMALTRFAQKLKGSEAALFYYSGHGLQIEGQNYLVPVDAPGDEGSMMPFDLVKLDEVIEALGYTSGIRLLILDACRNSPFAKRVAQHGSTRGGELTRGLARIERTQGMLIAYSTQPNMVAADGTGRNSPFTQALLQEMQVPGLEVGTLFRHVAIDVNRDTQGRQTPELSFSLLGEFYLNSQESDLDAWKRLGPSANADALKEFIAKFPTSSLIDAARARIAALEITSERERLIREYAEKERQLRLELEQAEAGFRKTSAELDELRKRNEARRVDEQHVIPQNQSTDQALAANPPPASEKKEQEKKEQDRLAAEVTALEANKKRLEAERASLEEALKEKLFKTQSDREQADRRVAIENARLPSTATEKRVTTAPMHQRSSANCQELTARAQLGDIAEADRSALKLCR